jgi:transcription initiation factor TFIID subunit TAF12
MRNLRHASLIAAIAAGIDATVAFTKGYEPNEAERGKHRRQAGYPQTGTGKRQGKRIRSQIKRGMLSVGSSGYCPPLRYGEAGIEF